MRAAGENQERARTDLPVKLLRCPGWQILEKAWRIHHRNTCQYFGGGQGSRGQIHVEGACHLPFILLPGIRTPLTSFDVHSAMVGFVDSAYRDSIDVGKCLHE